MMRAGSAVGQRVSDERKLAGLTQRQLATRANVSLSLVRKVEQGAAPASPAFVAAVARALGTGIGELLSQPYAPDNRAEHQLLAIVPALRRELSAYAVPPDEPVITRPLPELAAAVAEASEHRHAVNLSALGAELPGLLAELRAATWTLTGGERQRAFGLLAEAYCAAGQAVYKLGYIDLSSLTVDRYEWAAARSEDALAVLVGHYLRAGEMIMTADWSMALRLLDRGRAQIEDRLGRADGPTLSMWGNLHLKSALAAARGGDRDTADAHLTEARETAQRLNTDRDDYRLCFGPTNVNIWSVGIAVEMMDGTEAVKRANSFTLPAGAPRERVGHHWIDLARGYLLHGQHDRAVGALLHAKQTAPQQTRYHPMVHETIRTLARVKRRSDALTRLAAWAGVRGW